MSNRWTKHETDLLRANGADYSVRDLMTLLPGRTAQQIHSKRSHLGVRVRPEVTSAAKSEAQKGHAPTRSKIEKSLTLETMDPTDRSVMLGCLLGDGYLRKRFSNPFMGCSHGLKQRDYMEWKAAMLLSLHPRLVPLNRTNGSVGFETHSHPIFLDLHQRMYTTLPSGRNKKVHLPEDVVGHLGWLGLLVWYLDDGNMGWSNKGSKNPNGTMTIASTSTTTDELERACYTLNQTLGLNSYVRGPRDGKKQVVFPAKDRDKVLSRFEELIALHSVPEDITYKIQRKYHNG